MMRYALILFLALLLMACKKDENFGPQFPNRGGGSDGKEQPFFTYILNEGNFGAGNATIDRIDTSGNLELGLFESINGLKLGDVAQSMHILGDKAWIVVNNSGLIHEVTLPGLELVRTINVGGSPRYLIKHQGRFFITDLTQSSVRVYDEDFQFLQNIPLGGWCEELIAKGDRIFVVNVDQDRLDVIDSKTLVRVKGIDLGNQPQWICMDIRDNLWVLSDGGFSKNDLKFPILHEIDHDLLEINRSLEFGSLEMSPRRLKVTNDGQFLYWLNGGVYELDIRANSLIPEEIIPSEGRNLYGLGISPSDEVWISNAADYVSRGSIHSYEDGKEQAEFESGSIPQHIVFYPM